MLKKHIFHKSIHEKTPPFKRKLNWIHASRDNYTIISFFTCVEQELDFISNPRWKICSNSIVEEQTALTDLKNNQSIIIRLFDKCGCIFIMNARNYITKIHTLFQDHNMHKLLTHKPRNATAHDARTLIHYMHSLLKTKKTWHHGVFIVFYEYTYTSLFWCIKNTQAKLFSTLYYFKMWSSHWSSLIVCYTLYLASN